MTLPTDIFFTSVDAFDDDPKKYLNDLMYQLQDMYQQISQNVNGTIRNYADVDSSQWIPTLNGSTPGTFTYVNQTGWVLRQGIMTEVFFDLSWNATSASGNLYVELPYKVTKSNNNPFLGSILPSSITFGVGATFLNALALPNTTNLEIWQCGSGIVKSNLSVPASGGIIGYCRYIGTSDE